MDLLKLLKYKAEYGTVYYAEQSGKYVVCRQPTIAELAQLQDIQRSKKLTLQQQCQLIQRQTKVDGIDDLKLLEQVGEQILMDVPNDEEEYLQSQIEALEKMGVHEEVAVYIATNLGMDLNQVRKLSIQQAQQLFGLAKKVEELLQGGAEAPEPPTHKIQVNPVMRDAERR